MRWQIKTAILLCMTSALLTGCAQAPQTVASDVSELKCPPLPSSTVKAIRTRVASPKPPVTKSQSMTWIDNMRSDAAAKRSAGESVIRAYNACRKKL